MELKDNLYAIDRYILNTIKKRIKQEGTTYQKECKRILEAVKSPYARNNIKGTFKRLDNHVKLTQINTDGI